MKYLGRLLLLLNLWVPVSCFAAHITFPFMGSRIEVVDSAEGAALLAMDRKYPEAFSVFDIQSRLGMTARYQDYTPFAMMHTQNWDTTEERHLKEAFGEIAEYFTLEGIKLPLPPIMYLIRSDTKQEYGAEGYTRGSSIILNPRVQGISTGLVAHELFHVFSRFNEKKRDELYSVFGFKKCNPIVLTAVMTSHNITNPDCPVVAHYLTIDGEDMTLILYTDKDYTGGSVFEEYVKIGVLVLQGDETHKRAKIANGKPVIKELTDVPDLFKQVGTNTDYLLHPEELCAEHFSMMVTRKTPRQPELLEKFTDQLAR